MDSLSADQLDYLFSFLNIKHYTNLTLVCKRFYLIILRSNNKPKIKCDSIIFGESNVTLNDLTISTYHKISEDNCVECVKQWIRGEFYWTEPVTYGTEFINDGGGLIGFRTCTFKDECIFCRAKCENNYTRYCALCEIGSQFLKNMKNYKPYEDFFVDEKCLFTKCFICNKQQQNTNILCICDNCSSKTDIVIPYSKFNFIKHIETSYFKHFVCPNAYACNDEEYYTIKTIKYLKIKMIGYYDIFLEKDTFLSIAPVYLQIDLPCKIYNCEIIPKFLKNILQNLNLNNCKKILVICSPKKCKNYLQLEEIVNECVKQRASLGYCSNTKIFFQSESHKESRYKYYGENGCENFDYNLFIYLKKDVRIYDKVYEGNDKKLIVYHKPDVKDQRYMYKVRDFLSRNRDLVTFLTTKSQYMEYIFRNL